MVDKKKKSKLKTRWNWLKSIIAIVIFAAIKFINRLGTKKTEEKPAPAVKPDDIKLLEEIRDLLKEKKF